MTGGTQRLEIFERVSGPAIHQLDPMVHVGGRLAARPARETVPGERHLPDPSPFGGGTRVGTKTMRDPTREEHTGSYSEQPFPGVVSKNRLIPTAHRSRSTELADSPTEEPL